MGFGWQEIDKNLDLGYIRVAGLHRECKPAVLFDPPNFCPCTMTHDEIKYGRLLDIVTSIHNFLAKVSYPQVISTPNRSMHGDHSWKDTIKSWMKIIYIYVPAIFFA